MRGYVEESDEVKALRALRIAAERFVGAGLVDPFSHAQAEAETRLVVAALAYAKTIPQPKKRRKKR